MQINSIGIQPDDLSDLFIIEISVRFIIIDYFSSSIGVRISTVTVRQ
ncbi:MAG: hypothetical protein JWQ98_203 [Chlorobi bacterium]|nr:hypothetical protein [Chlorobiota bacterium]